MAGRPPYSSQQPPYPASGDSYPYSQTSQYQNYQRPPYPSQNTNQQPYSPQPGYQQGYNRPPPPPIHSPYGAQQYPQQSHSSPYQQNTGYGYVRGFWLINCNILSIG